MCIIIVNKTGILPEKIFKDSWDNNPDGAGLMYASDNKIIINKCLNDYSNIYLKYLQIRENFKGIIVIHFRISTSGENNYANCHPFRINPDLAFCHNGIISKLSYKNSKYSDTVLFNKKILKNLPVDFIQTKVLKELIRGYIGSSKLVFLQSDGQVFIMNEKDGLWKDDNWFSNKTYKKVSTVNYYNWNVNKDVYNKSTWAYDECFICKSYQSITHFIDFGGKKQPICNSCYYKGDTKPIEKTETHTVSNDYKHDYTLDDLLPSLKDSIDIPVLREILINAEIEEWQLANNHLMEDEREYISETYEDYVKLPLSQGVFEKYGYKHTFYDDYSDDDDSYPKSLPFFNPF